MTVQAGAEALTADQVAEFRRAAEQQGPQYADRFTAPPPPPADAQATVLAWFADNGVDEMLPETLAIELYPDCQAMRYKAFRWKHGSRHDERNIARADGVAVTEWRTVGLVFRWPGAAEFAALESAGIPGGVMPGEPAWVDFDAEDLVGGPGRPAMPSQYAALVDEWFAPNGITEWLPERAVIEVGHDGPSGAASIGWDGFVWPDGQRGYTSNIMTRGEVLHRRRLADDPSAPAPQGDSYSEAAVERRNVPLLVPVTDRIRQLFAASTLTLIEH